MITGSGVWVCVFPKRCNCVKFLCLNQKWMVLPVIFLSSSKLLAFLGDSSLLSLLLVEGFLFKSWLDSYLTHCH
jgi:hypothetical protein